MSFLFPSSSITLEAALRDAASSNLKARLRAVTALGDVEDVTERRRVVPVLVAALDDDSAAVRAEATASLGLMGEIAPVAAIVTRLSDGDPGVRQQAAIALGTLGDRAGFAPLLEALRDGPAELRYQAVNSLVEIDPVAAYEPLVAALGDRDAQVVSAAAVALGAVGDGRAVQHLVPLLSRSEADLRFEAAWALAELGDGRGRGELLAALPGAASAAPPAAGMTPRRRLEVASSVGHPARALEAVESLARLARAGGDVEDRRALAQLLTSSRAPAEAIVVAARHVLALLDGDEGRAPASDAQAEADRLAAQQVLVAALSARKDPLRGLAVEQLVAVGGAWALPALESLAGSRRGRSLAEPLDEARAAIAARAAGRVVGASAASASASASSSTSISASPASSDSAAAAPDQDSHVDR